MTEFVLAGVGEIAEHPQNVRREVGDVTELVASVKAQGVLQPLVVVADTSRRKTKYALIAGHRRLRAAKKAGLAHVPVVVRTDLVSVGDQVAAMVAENLHRADLSPVEEASAYQLLLDEVGLSVKEIAKVTGSPESTIRSRIRLQSLPPVVVERVHQRQMTLGAAAMLADLHDVDPAAAIRAADRPDVETAVRHEVRIREELVRCEEKVAEYIAAGWTVVRRSDLPEEWTGYRKKDAAMTVYDRGHQLSDAGRDDVVMCPDRAVVFFDDPRSAVYLTSGRCMNPSRHTERADTPQDNEARLAEAKARDELRAAQAAQTMAADVARVSRHAWLDDVITGGGISRFRTREVVAFLGRLLLTPDQYEQPDYVDLCDWLRTLRFFEVNDLDERDDHWSDDVLANGERLTAGTWALALALAIVENNLRLDVPMNGPAPESTRLCWVLLSTLGYTLTSFEKEVLARESLPRETNADSVDAKVAAAEAYTAKVCDEAALATNSGAVSERELNGVNEEDRDPGDRDAADLADHLMELEETE